MNKVFWLFLAGLNCCCACVLHSKFTGHLLFEQHVLLAVNVAGKKRSCSPEILLSCECTEEMLDLKLPYFPVPYGEGNHTMQAGSSRIGVDPLLEAGELSRHRADEQNHLLVQKLYTWGFIPMQIVAVNAVPSTAVCSAEPVAGINRAGLAAVEAETW